MTARAETMSHASQRRQIVRRGCSILGPPKPAPARRDGREAQFGPTVGVPAGRVKFSQAAHLCTSVRAAWSRHYEGLGSRTVENLRTFRAVRWWVTAHGGGRRR